MADNNLLTATQAARVAGVSTTRLRHLDEQLGAQRDPIGRRLYPRSAIEEFVRERDARAAAKREAA